MNADYFATHPLSWLDAAGDLPSIVLSSRIRVARNLAAFPFPPCADENVCLDVAAVVKAYVAKTPLLAASKSWDIDDLDPLSRDVLIENRQISPQFSGGGTGRFVLLDALGVASMMVGEEDHLRLQVFRGGLDLYEAWRIASVLDKEFSNLGFAFDAKWGYLTSCPTNVGTGLRASVMLHLPALEWSQQMMEVIRECNRMGLAVRGAFGEGSLTQAGLYQVSNQITLGLGEEEIMRQVTRVARKLAQEEERARDELYRMAQVEVEDRVWRAWGTLKFARVLSTQQAMDGLSCVKMGGDLGFLPKMPPAQWNHLILSVQPAHLEGRQRRKLKTQERHALRAGLVRGALEKLERAK